jgi:predicted site-specific integrase-resolvase
VYARVSSRDYRQVALTRQVAPVTTWAATHELAVVGVVTEVGSGLNRHRRKLLGLLGDPEAAVVVEHRDRFATFGGGVCGGGAVGLWS